MASMLFIALGAQTQAISFLQLREDVAIGLWHLPQELKGILGKGRE